MRASGVPPCWSPAAPTIPPWPPVGSLCPPRLGGMVGKDRVPALRLDDRATRGPHGMDYDDPRWADLRGGYGSPYDPREAFRRVEANANVEEAWDELCTELYHQGAVGEASYA